LSQKLWSSPELKPQISVIAVLEGGHFEETPSRSGKRAVYL
jgi:hypothetical protein